MSETQAYVDPHPKWGPARNWLEFAYDSGVVKRSSDVLDVYMLLSEPGVYYNAHGGKVSEKLAKQAGFDVKNLAKQRQLRERMSDVEARIRAELEAADEQPDRVHSELNGYKLVEVGGGRFHLKDPDGNVLSRVPLTENIGKKLLNDVARERDDAEGQGVSPEE